jgi:hypothetical protein
MTPEIVICTRTIEQRGIELPWREIKRYEPDKGKVLGEGTVFVPLDTLCELAEQDRWASQFGSVLLLDYQEGLALERAGLAERETKGGYHRTDLLLEFLAQNDLQ